MTRARETEEQETRVLVIEDNSAVRMMLEELLGDAGYRVFPFGDVPDPAEVTRLEPDLILLDVVIGGDRCGVDYLRTLRAIPSLRQVPVIVCSGDVPILDELSAMQPPLATAVLRKPIDLATFLDTVVCVMQKGHPPMDVTSGGRRSRPRKFLGSSHPGHGTPRRRVAARSPEIRAWLLGKVGALHHDGAQES